MTTTEKFLLRRRALYVPLAYVILPTALVVRHYAERLPAFFGLHVHDTLVTLWGFIMGALGFPRLTTWQLALSVLGFAFLVECSQLFQPPWIFSRRPGFFERFLWSDVVCYTAGVAIGVVLDYLIRFAPQGDSSP